MFLILLDLLPERSYSRSIASVQQNRRTEIQLLGYLIMKTITRAFVLALAVTGIAASTQISSASTSATITASKTSAMPTPMCPPDGSTSCNIRGGW
jgi:hypothetical protein